MQGGGKLISSLRKKAAASVFTVSDPSTLGRVDDVRSVTGILSINNACSSPPSRRRITSTIVNGVVLLLLLVVLVRFQDKSRASMYLISTPSILVRKFFLPGSTLPSLLTDNKSQLIAIIYRLVIYLGPTTDPLSSDGKAAFYFLACFPHWLAAGIIVGGLVTEEFDSGRSPGSKAGRETG